MKLIENIRAVATGNLRIIVDPLHTVSYNAKSSSEYERRYAKEYSIAVKIGANQWIDEDLITSSDGRVIQHALEEMKHAILENVYGEIYRDLIELNLLMRRELNYQETPSMKKLKEIMNEITL